MTNLSIRVTQEFGKGFTVTNLKYFRQPYLVFPAQSASGIGTRCVTNCIKVSAHDSG